MMSMEISANYKDYKNDYLERLQEGKDKVKETPKEQDAESKSEGLPVPKDEYISTEQSGSRPSGLYHMGKDENGNPKVMYDAPRKAEQPKVKSDSRKDDVEEVTGNTDAVDREIEKLKRQKQQLEQQIKTASGDEEKVKELEKKLSQVESELSQKDNDTYRRQHTMEAVKNFVSMEKKSFPIGIRYVEICCQISSLLCCRISFLIIVLPIL